MSDPLEIRLGSLTDSDLRISRSGIRWVCRDGQDLRKGDLLGYCNISLGGPASGLGALYDVDQERADLQVALVANQAGRLQQVSGVQRGGWHDRQELFRWDPDSVLATMTVPDRSGVTGPLLSHHFVAGRRASDLAEDRTGLLTGWHDRSRAWRQSDGVMANQRTGNVLGLGACDLFNVLRGDGGAFLEILEAANGPAQIVDVPDRPLVHSARIIIEQIVRTEAQREELSAAFAGAIGENLTTAPPRDWIFAAACVQALSRTPTNECYDILTRAGVVTTGPADAIILTLSSEPSARLRHKRSGFSFDCHTYRMNAVGPGLREWFKSHFELVPNAVDDIRRDYLEMVRLLRDDHPERTILVLNVMSTLLHENIISYANYDGPLGQTLRSYRARELNAMLDDIAREHDIAVVDVDAVGADMGGFANIPDGVHQNGPMQDEIRAEIVSALRARRVPGFTGTMLPA